MLNTKGNRITYFGHSTFSLTTPSGQVALIDPWVTTNPWCPDALKKVARLDAIFLTHAHTDHVGDLLALAKQFKPKIAAIFETCLWIESKGLEEETCPMGKGGSQTIGEFEITMTHAFHSNSIDDSGVRHYGACLLARVDGTSPVDYLDDSARDSVRKLGMAVVLDGIQHWHDAWDAALKLLAASLPVFLLLRLWRRVFAERET